MHIRLAIVVSHPIQYFAPWHREMTKLQDIEQRVFFCSQWGASQYVDPEFGVSVKWDVPLLQGYAHEFLPFRCAPKKMTFRQVDNPAVAEALGRFDPDVLMVFGYGHRTNWRAVSWAKKNGKPVLLYSDSSARADTKWWKGLVKGPIVRHFYSRVDAALYVGENNRQYHLKYGGPRLQLYPGALPVEHSRLLAAVPDRAQVRRDLRKQLGIPESAFVVMFCGKLAIHKRALDIVKAGHSLAQSGAAVWTLLVGDGPERRSIEEFCKKNDIAQNRITGFVNQSRIPFYYVASDIIVLSSSNEAYGIVLSEAIVFGLPVIVSDHVGCIGANDTARPGRNAIVYPCGDVPKLSAAIEALYTDPTLYRKMSDESVRISVSQDVTVAARQLASAVRSLAGMYAVSPERKSVHSTPDHVSS